MAHDVSGITPVVISPRSSIEDIFSTFVQFANDQFGGWMTDGVLRRSIRRSLLRGQQVASQQNLGQTSERFWALYWYQIWREARNAKSENEQRSLELLALGHLSAYLQETCYWVARPFATQGSGRPIRLSDCFQEAIATLPRLLQRYDPGQGSSLKAYAHVSFANAIRDALRQQGDTDRRTDWGLLRRTSPRRLEDALKAQGFSESTVMSYILAWRCFREYAASMDGPGTRQLMSPDRETWQAIAALYNSQRLRLDLVPPETTSEQLEIWLKSAARYLRMYHHPPVLSLNLPQSEGSGEVLDKLPDPDSLLPLDKLMAQEVLQERAARHTQMAQMLTTTLTSLDPELQDILGLYYGESLTQQEMANRLNTMQYTISRRLSRARRLLLQAIAQWGKETLHISLSPSVLEDMSIHLEEWLRSYYHP